MTLVDRHSNCSVTVAESAWLLSDVICSLKCARQRRPLRDCLIMSVASLVILPARPGLLPASRSADARGLTPLLVCDELVM